MITGALIDGLIETVEKVETISLVDGERCTHEWGLDEDGDARIICSVKTSLKCDACGEVYCLKHLALHKRYYCMAVPGCEPESEAARR